MSFSIPCLSHALRRRAALVLLLGLAWLPAAHADAPAVPPSPDAQTEHASLHLASPQTSVAPGSSISVMLTLRTIPHWHTYWKNPGDTGLPTRIRWTLPLGVSAGEIAWPVPSRLPTPPLMSFGYEGPAALLVPLSFASDLQGPLVLRAKVNWLVCAEQCIPESAEVGLRLDVGAAASGPEAAAVAQALTALPRPADGWTLRAEQDGHWLRIEGTVPTGLVAPERLWLFPDRKGLIQPPAAQPYHRDGARFTLAVPLAESPPASLDRLEGLLVDGGAPDRAWTFHTDLVTGAAIQPPKDNGSSAAAGQLAGAGVSGLLAALGLAFAGGLLLNLMPCVLPVLSLKVLALLGDAQAARAHLTRQGLAFLAGVLVSFWLLAGLLLALKSAGAAVGWGFQLQSPPFVVLLAMLFTLLALNFAGLFEIGTGLQAQAGELEARAGASASPLLASFSTGVLTTLVATPCTAPFLGAGIGFTLQRSAAEALLVFTAMGLGVGLPVTLLALFPAWLSRVPRPGAWMLALKQLFAFPMLATVAWLCWVLGRQRGVDAIGLLLLGLTLLALAGWLWGRAQAATLRAPGSLRARLLTLLALLCLLAGGWTAWPGPADAAITSRDTGSAGDTGGHWQAWSAERLQALRQQGRPVLVDFTAAWCISCQVNKRTSLHTAQVARRMQTLGVVPLEADWTNADPAITEALAQLHRNAVPVYAVYPKGGGEPRLLPEVLTEALVLDALDTAVQSGSGH